MPGQLGVFLAYPGIGKSWLSLYFAVQAWKQGRSPMIISLEMSEVEVRNRVFAIMGEGVWSHADSLPQSFSSALYSDLSQSSYCAEIRAFA